MFPGPMGSSFKAFTVALAVPVVIVAVGLLTMLGTWYRGSDNTFWFDVSVATFNIASFLQYPSLVLQIMGMQDCVPVVSVTNPDGSVGGRYLRSDFSISCGDPMYGYFLIASQVLVGVYVVGMPLTYAILMYANRGTLYMTPQSNEW